MTTPDPYTDPEFMQELARQALEAWLEVLSPATPTTNDQMVKQLLETVGDFYEKCPFCGETATQETAWKHRRCAEID